MTGRGQNFKIKLIQSELVESLKRNAIENRPLTPLLIPANKINDLSDPLLKEIIQDPPFSMIMALSYKLCFTLLLDY